MTAQLNVNEIKHIRNLGQRCLHRAGGDALPRNSGGHPRVFGERGGREVSRQCLIEAPTIVLIMSPTDNFCSRALVGCFGAPG